MFGLKLKEGRHQRATTRIATTSVNPPSTPSAPAITSAALICGNYNLFRDGEDIRITAKTGRKFKLEDVVKTCSKCDLTPIGVNRTPTEFKFVGVEFIGGGFAGNLWKTENFRRVSDGKEFEVVKDLEVFEEKLPKELFQELIRRN